MQIPVNEIQVKEGRRGADADIVRGLADSIREVGLLNPLTVDGGHVLIAGLHRLEAVKLLGWAEVECTISSLEGLQAELAEIDENIVRSGLPAVEYGEILLRRKEIYEALHPEVKHGGDRKSGEIKTKKFRFDLVKSFAQDTAEKLGVVPRTVELQIQTAKNLTPEAREIIKEADAKITKKTAMKLSRLEPEQQKEAAAKLAAKEIRSVDEYKAGMGKNTAEKCRAGMEKRLPGCIKQYKKILEQGQIYRKRPGTAQLEEQAGMENQSRGQHQIQIIRTQNQIQIIRKPHQIIRKPHQIQIIRKPYLFRIIRKPYLFRVIRKQFLFQIIRNRD